MSTVYCPHSNPSIEIIGGLCENRNQIILTGDFNCKHPELGDEQTNPTGTKLITDTQKNNLTLINDGTLTLTNNLGKEEYVNIHPFLIKWMRKQRQFHKADWIDINFAIRPTMTKTTLNKMTITEEEIDNYVNTLDTYNYKCRRWKGSHQIHQMELYWFTNRN